mgnify:FL=1
MLKKAIAVAAVSALSTPAFAGNFYVNVENNASYVGEDGKVDFTGSGTDFHLGYENGNAFGSYYIQGGLYVSSPDNADSESNFSGKVGGSVIASEKINVYGELSLVTDDSNLWGSKLGVKYSF